MNTKRVDLDDEFRQVEESKMVPALRKAFRFWLDSAKLLGRMLFAVAVFVALPIIIFCYITDLLMANILLGTLALIIYLPIMLGVLKWAWGEEPRK